MLCDQFIHLIANESEEEGQNKTQIEIKLKRHVIKLASSFQKKTNQPTNTSYNLFSQINKLLAEF